MQFIERGGQRATLRDDGVALYKVGATRPEPIPALADSLRRQLPSVERHVEQVRSYDTRTWTAAGLGAAGLIALGVGSALFVSAFKTDPRHSKADHGRHASRHRRELGVGRLWLGHRGAGGQPGASAAFTSRSRALCVPAAGGLARAGGQLDAKLQSSGARPL